MRGLYMRHRIFVVSALMPVWASVTPPAVAQPTQPPAFSTDLTRAAVRRVMTAAADWQLAHPSEHAPYDWTVAAFYTGMMALSDAVRLAEVLRRDEGDGGAQPVASRTQAWSRR